MREVTKENYIAMVKNDEDCAKLYKISMIGGDAFLRATIDVSTVDAVPWIETWCHELDTTLGFREAKEALSGESRKPFRLAYNFHDGKQKAVADFADASYSRVPKYLVCNNNELADVIKRYPNKAGFEVIYIFVED